MVERRKGEDLEFGKKNYLLSKFCTFENLFKN